MFDLFYNKGNVEPNLQMSMELSTAYSMKSEGYVFDYNCVEGCVLYTAKIIINIMKTIMIYFEFNKNNEYDYYSSLFDNFSTTANAVNDAYGIVRTQIANILTLQPKFSSLHEVISFKKKKKKKYKDYDMRYLI